MMMKRLLMYSLITGSVWFYMSRPSPPVVEAGPPAVELQPSSEDDPPLQRDLESASVFQVNGYQLHTLQAFALKARVLSVEPYRIGREADLSPIDIAFGWGRMSDPTISDKLSISQSGRWYHWRYSDEPPIPRREIETSSANMHMIPASREVADALRAVKRGELVSLRGYLVEATTKGGWK